MYSTVPLFAAAVFFHGGFADKVQVIVLDAIAARIGLDIPIQVFGQISIVVIDIIIIAAIAAVMKIVPILLLLLVTSNTL